MASKRTLIVWDRLGDYHRARVDAYKAICGEGNVYTADLGSADKLYGWKASEEKGNHHILSDKPVDVRDFRARIGAFRKLLKAHRIRQVAIAGYAHPEYFFFLMMAKLAGCRVVMFAESWYGTGRFRNFIKGLFLRTFVDKVFLSGKRAATHFSQQLGYPEGRIIEKYSVVDNQHFSADPAVPRRKELLCVARFSPEKNLPRLISAFQESELSKDHVLKIIGGGPQKDQLLGLVDQRRQVELVDWVTYQDLPDAYGRARFFILPSIFEPWGLVVNEAMAAGLPIIASDACGCVPDLVTSQNGFVFPSEDKDQLIKLLNTLVQLDQTDWERMSAASIEIISGYRCEDWAENLKQGFMQHAHH